MDYMIEQILPLIKAFKGIENERREILKALRYSLHGVGVNVRVPLPSRVLWA